MRVATSFGILTSLGICSAFMLTLIATLLISYRIVTASRETAALNHARNIYRDIVDLVIQSSSVYSAILVVWAIVWIIAPPSTGTSGSIYAGFAVGLLGNLSFFAAVGTTSNLSYFHSD